VMYECVCNGVCLFIWRTYSFVCTIHKSMLEVDCEAVFMGPINPG
jgi:hypothetical protein